MIESLLIILLLIALGIVALQVMILRRASEVADAEAPDPAREDAIAADLARRIAAALEPSGEHRARIVREDLSLARREQTEAAERLRESLAKQSGELRGETTTAFAAQRTELLRSLQQLTESLEAQLASIRTLTQQKLDESRLLTQTELEKVRTLTQQKLDETRQVTEKSLSEMRGVVEEKLQKALEERVGAAFRGVGERLEEVQKGLGEMRALVGEVGDLKRVLTNVKTRGVWGEAQLAAILGDFLAPDQYENNASIRPESSERVEFAVKCPGGADGESVLLPIDSKFPREDYERLLLARERADAEAAASAGLALERAIRDAAADIARKYIAPPRTVPFAILFVPTEGLYAELMQRPGLADLLQRTLNVTIAGPSTLAAMLISFRIGFRTLAIQKRSDEVWRVLGRAKTEFAKFGEVIDAVQKHLERAQNQLTQTGVRTRQIEKALKGVEVLPEVEASTLPTSDRAEADERATADGRIEALGVLPADSAIDSESTTGNP